MDSYSGPCGRKHPASCALPVSSCLRVSFLPFTSPSRFRPFPRCVLAMPVFSCASSYAVNVSRETFTAYSLHSCVCPVPAPVLVLVLVPISPFLLLVLPPGSFLPYPLFFFRRKLFHVKQFCIGRGRTRAKLRRGAGACGARGCVGEQARRVRTFCEDTVAMGSQFGCRKVIPCGFANCHKISNK